MRNTAQHSFYLVVLGLAFGASSSPARADAPYFLPLGDLPGGGFASIARGVSGDGSVVVGTGASAGGIPNEAFRWTRTGGMVGLGDLDHGNPPGSQAWGVSGDGSVVVGNAFHGGFGTGEAFRWTSAGGMVGLGHLPGPTENRYSMARAVSRDGRVVVGYSNSARAPDGEAFRWTAEGGMTDLGTWPDGVGYARIAYGTNSDGSVVVGGGYRAFRWTAEQGLQDLGHLPGGSEAGAFAVSADGRIVVGASNFQQGNDSGGQPFRWTAEGGMVGLGRLPGGLWAGGGFGVSDDGNTIVGQAANQQRAQVPFIWDPQHGMRDLVQVFTQDYGFDLNHWAGLIDAFGVSGDGLTIVGYGINVDDNAEAWVAHLPEPASFWLLALAALAGRRMR